MPKVSKQQLEVQLEEQQKEIATISSVLLQIATAKTLTADQLRTMARTAVQSIFNDKTI